MESRDVLLKADRVSVVFERLPDGKIRVTTSSWDDAKVILPNQVLEVAVVNEEVGLVPGGQRWLISTWTPPGLWKRVTVGQRADVTLPLDVTRSRSNATGDNRRKRPPLRRH